MTQEEILRLEILQHELLTQPPDGTRDPRIWGLMEPFKEYGVTEGYADGYIIHDQYGDLISDEDDEDPQVAIRSIIEENDLTENDLKDISFRSCEGNYDVYEAMAFRGDLQGQYELIGFREKPRLVKGTFFLTRKGADEYLKKFGYNHPKGTHPYSMYPYRCWEYQLVVKLLKELDLDLLKKLIEEKAA